MKNLAEKTLTVVLALFAIVALGYSIWVLAGPLEFSPAEQAELTDEYPWVSFEGDADPVDFGSDDTKLLLSRTAWQWRIYFNRTQLTDPETPWNVETIQPLSVIQAGKWIFFQVQGAPTWQQGDADIVTFAYYYCEECRYWKPGFVWSANLNSFFVVMYNPETETGMVYDTSGNLVFDVTIEKE